MRSPTPLATDLVLLGGGHSHALVLRKWGMNPLPGVRLTLITDLVDTPYSGMLPSHVAGVYDFDEAHIDLRPLARFAHGRLVMDRAVGLDLAHQRVLCAHHPPIAFDVLSINTGSTPATVTVPGAQTYAIPAKPVPNLLRQWQDFLAEIQTQPDQPRTIAIVGGGVGGVELTLNMEARLAQLFKSLQLQAPASPHPPAGRPHPKSLSLGERDFEDPSGSPSPLGRGGWGVRANPRHLGTEPHGVRLTLHLFHRGSELAEGRNRWTRRRLLQICQERGIQVHLKDAVTAITLDKATGQNIVHSESGLALGCDRVFWVTNAAAPEWLQDSGLSLDDQGFIQVGDTLQTLSHPNIFAAGDVATLVNHPRPKAGVFAVRQGPPLYENLRRFLQGHSPQPFRPQRKFLNLIDVGYGQTIAARGPFAWESPLCRRWKDHIDRKFMALFTEFPAMPPDSPLPTPDSPLPTPDPRRPTPPIPCSGCGSKIGSTVLSQAIRRVRLDFPHLATAPTDLLIGLESPDDAAVMAVPPGRVMVHTVDYFPALVEDPFVFAQIALKHGLSDLYAMGSQPHSVLAMVQLPYATPQIQEETLYHLLSGIYHGLQPTGTPLVGGHTLEGPQLALGFACNGVADPDHLLRKGGMVAGDRLILTQALGTGTLFAAEMQKQAKGRWIEAAIEAMIIPNRAAAEIFRQHQATACTDVTGFGLAGHLLEMVNASAVSAVVDLDALPTLPGAQKTLAQGFVSSLQAQNLQATQAIATAAAYAHHPNYPLLFDPQTAGGLLATIPADQAQACLDQLHQQGYPAATIIGTVQPQNNPQTPLSLQFQSPPP
ncbi:MAG: selenide, water dikinase SelD [Leptolyngbya sp.]|nr:selenide, water dikinase SelD [Leptolyngbya sp.]